MGEIQYGTIRISQIVKVFTDSIGQEALLESIPEKEYWSKSKTIQRLQDENKITESALREYESLIKDFCAWALKKRFINETHNYIIPTLYFDMLSLITNTNPYNNPTQKEVELQIMYCIVLTLREIYDHLYKTRNMSIGETLQITLGMFDFWKGCSYNENVDLITSCFNSIFKELNQTTKSKLYKYWEKLKDKQDETNNKKTQTTYSKTINDWINQGITPKWNTIKCIFASEAPNDIEFNNLKTNYDLFRMNLFVAYFFSNFFKSLEDQSLVSTEFKYTVQNGIRWFYRYVFEKHGDFSHYEVWEIQNPMFSLMRFMIHPSPNNRCFISERIFYAFEKEVKFTLPEINDCQSLYYIPQERIGFPIVDYAELNKDLDTFAIVLELFQELSTCEDYGAFTNKTITEDIIDEKCLSTDMGLCRDFFHNWFKGKYLVLCHDFNNGIKYYDKAFENRYFGGKNLAVFLEEYYVLANKCNYGKIQIRKIHEWANCLKLYIENIDNAKEPVIRSNFDDVFPTQAFIK